MWLATGRIGYGRKKILEHFFEPCSLLAAELIIRIIKITPAVRALRLGSARVICLFGVEHTEEAQECRNSCLAIYSF